MTTQEAVREVLQVYLVQDTGTTRRGALLSAVIGAGGGPVYRFVAAPPESRHDAAASVATGNRFPLQPFQDLDAGDDDEWTELARRRLAELDRALRDEGWLPEEARGPHWWSLRYTR